MPGAHRRNGNPGNGERSGASRKLPESALTTAHSQATVNGQDVIVTTGGSGDIRVAIRAWEESERHRLLHDLANLARLVDGALTRPQPHRTLNDHRNPPQEAGALP